MRDLHHALQLTSAHLGNAERRRLLLDSKDEPWSAAERKFHRLLRDPAITAWKANQLVVLGGSLFFLDVVFRGLKLAVELDGRLYHSGSEVFETDRWRQNLLVLDGWCVLRFTSAMIDERPAEVMAMVREALEMLGADESAEPHLSAMTDLVRTLGLRREMLTGGRFGGNRQRACAC